MSLKLQGYIDLPVNRQAAGFDHAAVHSGSSRLYVAHTSNDAIDVIDCAANQFLFSIPHLIGVAGTLVSEEHGLIFTSNRGEDTVGIFQVYNEQNVKKSKLEFAPTDLPLTQSADFCLQPMLATLTFQTPIRFLLWMLNAAR